MPRAHSTAKALPLCLFIIFFPFALQPGFNPASRARVVYAVCGPNPSKSSVTG
jgi:hypothetical protein